MLTTSPCTRALCARCALAIALVLGLGLICNAQNSAVNFNSSQPIFSADACGNTIIHFLPGKFQRSSQPDLVTSCFSNFPPDNGPFTAALINMGSNGLFLPVPDHSIDFIAAPVQAVDLNGDGFDDLIEIEIPAGNLLAIQLSNGDGTFQNQVYYSLPSNSVITAAVAGDFEHNGRMDVAVLTSVGASNNLTIFLNDGTGKLTQSATYALNATPAGFNHPILVAGDINNDGKVDVTVVYTGTTGTAVPYISQGNGKFTKGSARSAGDSPITAAWGDFNNDGFGDIAVATPTGFNIIFGSSSGNFTGSKFTYYPTPIATLNAGLQIAPGDFDKDGNLDLAVSANNGVDIFWGAGNGTFSTISSYSDTGAGLFAADMNGDGKLDLVSSSGFKASILYNLGGRSFRAAPTTHSPNANGIVAGDFNGNGKQGIAVVNTPTCAAPCNGTVTVFPGEGSYFGAGKTYSIGMHGSAIAAGDLNGDGLLDLVVTNTTPGDNADVSILLGTKTGGFSAAHNLTLGSLSNDAILVDVNGDGKLDLVEDGGVAFGDGKGSFGNLTPFPDGIGYTKATYLTVADFNGDGHPDIAVTWLPSGSDQQADVLINDGKGNLSGAPFDISGFFEFITGITAGPVNGGKVNDIVFAGSGTSSSNGHLNECGVFVLLNDGKGNFTFPSAAGPTLIYLPLQIDEGPPSHGVVIADFNKDGHNDIGFSAGNEFYVATGPSFNVPMTPFAATINTSYSAVADFNKDGWPDIVFTSPYGVSRLYNVPVPTVTPGAINFTGPGSQNMTVKNTTTTSQAITAAFQTGGSSTPGFILFTTCKTLAAGASCTISVDYGSLTGVSAILYISSNGQFIDAINISAP